MSIPVNSRLLGTPPGRGLWCRAGFCGRATASSMEAIRRNSVPTGFKSVFPIDTLRVAIRKQSTLRLGQMQADTSRRAAGGQKLADVIHMRARLQFLRELFQRDQCGCQCLRDHPVVVTRDSFPRHQITFPADQYRGNLSRQANVRARPKRRQPDEAGRHRYRDRAETGAFVLDRKPKSPRWTTPWRKLSLRDRHQPCLRDRRRRLR